MAAIATTHTPTPPLVTFSNFNPLKLDRDNYNLWIPQIVPQLKGGNLYGYVDGTILAPPPTVSNTSDDGVVTITPNPAFLHWQMQDQLILGAINSSLSPNMLSFVTRCATSRDAWVTLENMFNSQAKARTMNVHFQLVNLKKGNSSIADYFQKFQQLTDALASVSQPLKDIELVSFLLSGLGPEYDSFVTSVQTRVDTISIEALYGHLLAHELRLDQHNSTLDLSVAGANVASRGSHSRGGRGGRGGYFHGNSSSRGSLNNFHSKYNRGRGRGSSHISRGHSSIGPHSGSSSRLICQVCQKPGHGALDCYRRFDTAFARDSDSPINAYYSSASNGPDRNWYLDSGATHHLTSDLENLNLRAEPYMGSDQVKIGNGKGLPIHHIGHTHISSPYLPFKLFDVLHVPQISKNLISIHKFTKDTNTLFEFHPYYFLLKDRATGKVLFRGPNKDGLYHFLPHANKSSTSALVGERVSIPQWHSRLGHPALKVVRKVLSSFQLPFHSSPVGPLCRACLSSKSKQLPFATSQSQTTCPLELVFTDVWGPAPVSAKSGSKYYVSFLDSFSKYTWLYPIHNKSDVTSIFIRFKSYVECFFGLKIKSIQSDWGGEYRPFTKLLQSHGISHRVSCPHTHQQNGAVVTPRLFKQAISGII
jgi:hypothetical protein